MTRAGVYVRLSNTDRKEGDSIKAQLKQCRELAKSEGYTIVAEYKDNGISGNTLIGARPGLAKAFKDAQAGKFERLIMRGRARFSRSNARIAMHQETEFVLVGVLPHYVRDGLVDPENLGTEITGFLMQSAKHDYLQTIRKNTLEGRYRRAAENKIVVGGITIFGYRRVRHKVNTPKETYTSLAVVSKEAAVIRQIYKWFLNDETYTQIANRLNKKKIKRYNPAYRPTPTRNGKPTKDQWIALHIKRLLTEQQYTGVRFYGVMKARKQLDGSVKRWIVDPATDDTVVEQTIDPIVDKKTFDTAQKKIKTLNRKFARRPPSKEYLLRSRISCDKCGKGYYCKTYAQPSGSTLYRYRHAEANKTCSNYGLVLKQELVDDWVKKTLTARAKWSDEEMGQWVDEMIESIPAEYQEGLATNSDIDVGIMELKAEDKAERKLVTKGTIREVDYIGDRDERLKRIVELEASRVDLTEVPTREELLSEEQAMRRYFRYEIENNRDLDYFELVDQQELTIRVLNRSKNVINAKLAMYSHGKKFKQINGRK